MAYTVNITLIDFGGFLPTTPGVFIGRFASPAGIASDTVLSTVGPITLPFPLPASPPGAAATLHVTDVSGPGDVFRSGVLTSWPANPGSLTVISVPMTLPNSTGSGTTPVTSFGVAQINGFIAPLIGTVLPVPAGIQALSAALTGLLFIPVSMAVTGAAILLTAPNLISLTVTGVLTFRRFLFPATSAFTATIILSVAPSGDATNQGRILAIRVVSAGLNPGFITPGISLTAAALAPIIAQAASGLIDGALNSALVSRVSTALAARTPPMTLSPTASLCARRITVTASGIAAQMIASDLLGPVIPIPVPPSPPRGKLSVALNPTPQANVAKSYVVTVTNQTTGQVLPGATVKIKNYTASGAVQNLAGGVTGSNGTVTVPATLRYKKVTKVSPIDHSREVTFVSPTITVSMTGFASLTQNLLPDVP